MQTAIFNTKSSGHTLDDPLTESNELMKYNDTLVTVIRPLTQDEADIDDIGPMYSVKFTDGYITDVFEDELTFQ